MKRILCERIEFAHIQNISSENPIVFLNAEDWQEITPEQISELSQTSEKQSGNTAYAQALNVGVVYQNMSDMAVFGNGYLILRITDSNNVAHQWGTLENPVQSKMNTTESVASISFDRLSSVPEF